MNTIYSLIQCNLKKTLIVSLSAASLIFIAYSFLSFRWTESQALRFITTHTTALAQAGVSSQNVNEIDKEIGRFVQTWKETQDLDLRVDIFLNDRLVAHGGQLLPFQYFHSNTEENIVLPSGEALRIKIEIGLLKFFLSGVLLLSVVAGFVLGVFYLLMRSMRKSIKSITSPLETRIDWLKAIANDLPNSAKNGSAPSVKSEVQEIDELGSSIRTLLSQIVLLEERLVKTNFDRGRVKTAKQVAHIIKGIIGTLQLKIDSVHSLSEMEKHDLGDCLNSLRDLSVEILKPKMEEHESTDLRESQEPLHVLPVVDSVLSAKRRQFVDRKGIQFSNANRPLAFGLFCAISSSDLQTILVNLVDNAAEAIEGSGAVTIHVSRKDKNIEMVIEDTGVGIPAHIMPLLVQEDATFGKTEGNGVGLSHVNELLKKTGGKFLISSIEGKGTKVILTLPLASLPQGFLSKIEVAAETTLVVVDDDPLMPMAWKLRLANDEVNVKEIVHLSSLSKFRDWVQENGQGELGERLYIFDYDLKDDLKGLDLIEHYGLAFESVLVSGAADREEVKGRAVKMGVSWLSKEFLEIVPLSNSGSAFGNVSSPGAV